jgi:tetratricopeptide (TPR) repeat protein
MKSLLGQFLSATSGVYGDYRRAMDCVQIGNFDEALFYLDRVLQSDETLYMAWCDKGNILRHFGRYHEALECYERSLQLNPSFTMTWYNKGLALLDMGRFQEALEALNNALSSNPDDAEALTARSTCQIKLGDMDGALNSLNQALRLNPRYDVALVNKGLLLLELNHPTDALASFDSCLHHNPSSADALAGKGSALHEMGRYQEALVFFDKSLAVNASSGQVWGKKGHSLMELGQPKQAGECYERAVRNTPHSATIRLILADYYASQGRYDDAIAQYNEAIRLNPEYARAHYELGTVYIKLKRMDDAYECFERARRYDPDLRSPIVPASRDGEPSSQYAHLTENAKAGLEAFNHGDYYKATGYFRTAIYETTDSRALFLIHWLLGGCQRRLGFLEEAVENLNTALSHSHGQPASEVAHVYNDLAITLEIAGKYDQALEAIENALKLQPNYINARLTGAGICLSRNDFDGMIRFGKEVLDLASNPGAVRGSARLTVSTHEEELMADRYRSEALGHIGVGYWGKGDTHNALRFLQEALDCSRYNSLAETAISWIKRGQTLADYQNERHAGLVREGRAGYTISPWAYRDPKLRETWEEYGHLIAEAMEMWRRGRFDGAVRSIEAARRVLPDQGADAEHAACDNILSLVHMEKGEYEEALKLNRRVLDTFTRIDSISGRCQALTNQGLILLSSGEHSRAIDVNLQALRLAKEIGNMESVAANLGDIGISYAYLGNFHEAIEYHEQALAIDTQYRSLDNAAKDNGNLASCYFSLMMQAKNDEEFEYYAVKAEEHQNRILDFYRRARTDRFMEMQAIKGFAHIQSEHGRRKGDEKVLEGCLSFLDEATMIAQSIGNLNTMLQILAIKGNIFRSLAGLANSQKEAAGYLNASEAFLREVNSRTAADAGFRHQLAQTYEAYIRLDAQNRVLRSQQAFLCYEDAIQNIDRHRQDIFQQELRISYVGSQEQLFCDGIALCVKMHRDGIPCPSGDPCGKAFEFVEACKSRTLLDILGTKELRRPDVVSPEHTCLFEREAACLAEIHRMGHGLQARGDSYDHEIARQVWNNLDEIYAEMGRVYPEYVSIRRGKPLSAPELHTYLQS